jgi:hypothetical protein
MNLDLPATGSDQPPQFLTPDQCRTWLKSLPLSSPIQAQAQLLRQLHLLNRYALPGDTRLMLLEALREPIHFVQEESAKKFSAKPLPLAPPEQAALDTSHGLWEALVTGYLRCLDACSGGDALLKGQAALICQRALAALADDLSDLVRAGYHPGSSHWRRAHALYAGAEALGVATAAVEDGLRASQPIAPAAAYAELLLLAAASLHELTPRQQTWVMRWTRRWAGKVSILAAPPSLDSSALPLCVDLDSENPASYRPLPGSGARWLETTELRKSLKRRITLLERGAPEDTPARLGLGDDCTQPACGETLKRLYPRWVKGGVLRRHERHPMSGTCRFVAGVEAAHYYLSGHQPFKPPGHATSEELRRQREEIATFDRVANRHMADYSRNQGFQLESWEVSEDWGMADQSNGGLRVVRPLKQAGGRLGIGQLVAVQPPGSSTLVLGVVRWAQVRDEQMTAGIQLYAGRALPVAVRGTGVMANREIYRQGFFLPAVASLQIPDSLILPPGSYKPKRIMEAWSPDGTREFRLVALIDRGADFERAACEAKD